MRRLVNKGGLWAGENSTTRAAKPVRWRKKVVVSITAARRLAARRSLVRHRYSALWAAQCAGHRVAARLACEHNGLFASPNSSPGTRMVWLRLCLTYHRCLRRTSSAQPRRWLPRAQCAQAHGRCVDPRCAPGEGVGGTAPLVCAVRQPEAGSDERRRWACLLGYTLLRQHACYLLAWPPGML